MDCTEEILEKEFQDKINNSKVIKKNIAEVLNIRSNSYKFEKEVEFINGITSDFIIYDNNNVLRAIIECKRSDIGVTEFVRGAGQMLQYEYFSDNFILPKKFQYLHYPQLGTANILMIPSSFIRNTTLNLGKFKFPKSCILVEVHINNNFVRRITDEELQKISAAENDNLVTICQYYLRDNRLFEYYILLNLLTILDIFESDKSMKFSRKKIENILLKNISVINNGNWRNAFISLSGLGFIDHKNRPTSQSSNLHMLPFESFVNTMYTDYIHPFVDEIMGVFIENESNGWVNMSNIDIANYIRNKYKQRDVLFLSESNSRYISSWLNIMRDDIGCVDFQPKSPLRKINFIPAHYNPQTRIEKIREFTKGQEYCDRFNNIKKSLVNREI